MSPFLAVASLAWSVLVVTQEPTPVRIPDAVTCTTCRITTTPVATLGADDGPGSFTMPPAQVSRDSQGRFWVLGGNDDAAGPVVFGPDGRLIGAVGRRGEGPGEFQNVHDVVLLPGDSVLVMDGNFRATLVGPDLLPKRFMTIPAPLEESIAVSWPGGVIGFSHHAAGLRGGPTLHVMSFDKPAPRIVRSFGPGWTMTESRSRESVLQRLASSRTGMWSARHWRYQIDHWSRDFALDRRLIREPAWFPDELRGLGPGQPPPPRLYDVVEDDEGRVWAFSAVPAPTWREAWPDRRADGSVETRMAAVAFEKLYRTIVEVIDPAVGRVVARAELDQVVVAALPGLLAVLHTADADGIVRLKVVRLSLLER